MSAQNWRDEAMIEALSGYNNEQHCDAIIGAIRRLAPGISTHQIWAPREQTVQFVQAQCGEVRSLLA